MTLRLRFPGFVLAVACAGHLMAAGPFAFCQTTAASSDQRALDARPAPRAAGTNPQDKQEWVGQYFAYESLLYRIRIEAALSGQDFGGAQGARTDFAEICGTGEDKAEAVLAILTEAAPRVAAVNHVFVTGQFAAKPAQSREEAAEWIERIDQLVRQKEAVLDQTIARLKGELGTEEFSRLDAWVYQNWRPANVEEPDSDAHPVWSRAYTHYRLITLLGGEEQQARRRVLLGEPPLRRRTDLSNFPGVRGGEEQAIHSALLDGYDRIISGDRESIGTVRALRQKFGQKRMNEMVHAPEIDALSLQAGQASEQAFAELRRTLGDEDFAKFDDYTYHMFAGDGQGRSDGKTSAVSQ